MEQALIDYIKQAQAKGTSEENILAALREAGWQEEDIKEALKSTESKQASTKKKSSLPLIVGAIALIFLLIGGGVSAALYTETWNPGWNPFVNKIENEEQVVDEYAGWQTYRNKYNTWQVKIPPDWSGGFYYGGVLVEITGFGKTDAPSSWNKKTQIFEESPYIVYLSEASIFVGDEEFIWKSIDEQKNNLVISDELWKTDIVDYDGNIWRDTLFGPGARPEEYDTSGWAGICACFWMHGEFSEEMGEIYNKIVASFEFIEPNPTREEYTASWPSYTNSTHGYSLRIHPEWQHIAESPDHQKRFKLYSDEMLSLPENQRESTAEFQILILDLGKFPTEEEDAEFLKNLEPGTESEIYDMQIRKIKNVALDDKCEASQIFFKDGDRYAYSSVCLLTDKSITLLLLAYDAETVYKYKPIYDDMLSTFMSTN